VTWSGLHLSGVAGAWVRRSARSRYARAATASSLAEEHAVKFRVVADRVLMRGRNSRKQRRRCSPGATSCGASRGA
jgi:hypothetical protein